MVSTTNHYADQRHLMKPDPIWTDTSPAEIKAYSTYCLALLHCLQLKITGLQMSIWVRGIFRYLFLKVKLCR